MASLTPAATEHATTATKHATEELLSPVGVVDAYIRHSAKRMICIEPLDRIVYIGRVEGDSDGLTRTYRALSEELLGKRRESMRSLLVLCAVRVACVVV